MDRIRSAGLAHVHVIVDDIDEASAFYREVMDFLEMQSHHGLTNPGLARYYGIREGYKGFSVSLRFLAWPGVLTLKLVHVEQNGSTKRRSGRADLWDYGGPGVGPLSIELEDIDATYEHLQSVARDYGSRWKIQLLSEPVFLSPLMPHEIGTTEHSVLHGNKDILDELERRFPERAKFQMIDPFGVRWEFNNATT